MAEKDQELKVTTASSGSINLENLYDKFKKYDFNSNQLKVMRTMLLSLGFKFYIDANEKYMVKISEKFLIEKLKLILRCLKLFQSNLSLKVLKIFLFNFLN